MRLERLCRLVSLSLCVFKRLRFVKYDDIPFNIGEHFFVALQQRVARQHDVGTDESAGVRASLSAVVAVNFQGGCETFGFALPVTQHRGGRNDQVGFAPH